MITGLYIPGDSLLHRCPAGVKLIALVLIGIGLIAIDNLFLLCALAVVVAASYSAFAGLGVAPVWQATRAVLVWLALIVLAQALLAGVEAAAETVVRLLILIWSAALVSYTSRLSDMAAVLERGLAAFKPLGVQPEKTAFMIALTLRLVPAIFAIARDVRDAQRARGVDASVVTAIVPALTRIMAHADAISDALTARGYERWDTAP